MATRITKAGQTVSVRRTNSLVSEIKKRALSKKTIPPPPKKTTSPKMVATTRSKTAAAGLKSMAEVVAPDNSEILPVAMAMTVTEEKQADTIDNDNDEGIKTLKLVAEATRFLKTISFYNVHAELQPRFKTSMFENTVLDRNTAQGQALEQDQQQVNNNGNSLDNRPGPSSRINQARTVQANQNNHVPSLDEIFRKNLYYLASIMLNVDEILIQLVQLGAFRLAEKDLVVDPQFHGKSTLKALKMYEILLQKDENKFGMFKEILRHTNNEESYNLLQLPIPVADDIEVDLVPRSSASSIARVRNSLRLTENLTPGSWICEACTYINKPDHLNCDVCGKVVLAVETLELEELNNSIRCTVCTYENETNTIDCIMCGSRLADLDLLL